jgi:hypothetical protein
MLSNTFTIDFNVELKIVSKITYFSISILTQMSNKMNPKNIIIIFSVPDNIKSTSKSILRP